MPDNASCGDYIPGPANLFRIMFGLLVLANETMVELGIIKFIAQAAFCEMHTASNRDEPNFVAPSESVQHDVGVGISLMQALMCGFYLSLQVPAVYSVSRKIPNCRHEVGVSEPASALDRYWRYLYKGLQANALFYYLINFIRAYIGSRVTYGETFGFSGNVIIGLAITSAAAKTARSFMFNAGNFMESAYVRCQKHALLVSAALNRFKDDEIQRLQEIIIGSVNLSAVLDNPQLVSQIRAIKV